MTFLFLTCWRIRKDVILPYFSLEDKKKKMLAHRNGRLPSGILQRFGILPAICEWFRPIALELEGGVKSVLNSEGMN